MLKLSKFLKVISIPTMILGYIIDLNTVFAKIYIIALLIATWIIDIYIHKQVKTCLFIQNHKLIYWINFFLEQTIYSMFIIWLLILLMDQDSNIHLYFIIIFSTLSLIIFVFKIINRKIIDDIVYEKRRYL